MARIRKKTGSREEEVTYQLALCDFHTHSGCPVSDEAKQVRFQLVISVIRPYRERKKSVCACACTHVSLFLVFLDFLKQDLK